MAMGRIEKTVFVSYRRHDAGWALAVFQDLFHNGYDVFIDYDGIASGNFETAILENIRARAHFLVLLTPTALERTGDPKDWMRREIEAALDSHRNIVPLMLAGFKFGAGGLLTGKLASLEQYNGLSVPEGFFPEAMERLRNRFLDTCQLMRYCIRRPTPLSRLPKNRSKRRLRRRWKMSSVSWPAPNIQSTPHSPTVPAKSSNVRRALGWLVAAAAILTSLLTIVNQRVNLIDEVWRDFSASTASAIQQIKPSSKPTLSQTKIGKLGVVPGPRYLTFKVNDLVVDTVDITDYQDRRSVDEQDIVVGTNSIGIRLGRDRDMAMIAGFRANGDIVCAKYLYLRLRDGDDIALSYIPEYTQGNAYEIRYGSKLGVALFRPDEFQFLWDPSTTTDPSKWHLSSPIATPADVVNGRCASLQSSVAKERENNP